MTLRDSSQDKKFLIDDPELAKKTVELLRQLGLYERQKDIPTTFSPDGRVYSRRAR